MANEVALFTKDILELYIVLMRILFVPHHVEVCELFNLQAENSYLTVRGNGRLNRTR